MSAFLFVHLKRGQRTLESTARRLELEFPELGSHLINLVQFAECPDADPFRAAAVAQAAEAVAGCPFHKAATKETRWRRFQLCMQTPRDFAEALAVLGVILFAGYLLHAQLPHWDSSVRRLLRPWEFVPSVGAVKIVKVTPGDTEVLVGASLEISAEIDNPEQKPCTAALYVRSSQQPETTLALRPDEKNQRFVAVVPQVLVPLRYRLEIGDSQTKLYSVRIGQKPAIADIEVTYRFPAYLDRPPATVQQKHGDLEAPQFTQAELRIHPVAPIEQGYLELGTQRVYGRVEDEGRTCRIEFLLTESASYTIHLFTASHYTDAEPRVQRIRVLPDAPPTVQLLEPAPDRSVATGSKTTLAVRAQDDYGLGWVWLELRANPEAAAETVASWTRFSTPTNAVLVQELSLDPARFKAGATLLVRAVAEDRRHVDLAGVKLGPQQTATAWRALRVISPEAKAANDLAQLESLRTALWKVLQEQIKARVTAADVPRQATFDAGKRLAGEVRARQITVQKMTADIVPSISATGDPERLAIKHAANKLAFGDMLAAIRQADELGQAVDLVATARPTAVLTATQDRIIDVLRRLLNELRRETAEVLAEMKKRPGTELPPDVQDQLRNLKDKLQDFLKQQKKVIEATEDLAKKAVDDFTEKEKQLLKELAATEDDWARFLADKGSDLSKLPAQDFANPSLLQKLVEVETELKMAEGALTKRAVDIAVPLEQLGAEMAKEITTNIEKWLPDTPDRERWSLEEPLTDAMKEAPMAELPKELEDIVGKRMEEEEDLFDELEDKSSSWADSIDKGAGWDAADGSISNNSARGVTGNRLPNNTEIGGRSGEGRQGRASGEFVGDSATGKGGRKTPSRLTPDPQMKGQVKDRSKDPVGGATGGGKESGQGGEGLHGPVPNRPERDLGRLAGKQAELRNKAESVDLRFKVHKFHHTDFQRLIETMAAVEGDLRSGRYREALRRRDVLLEGLDHLRLYVRGEFLLRRDQTANLPANIQKEILGSMHEPSPAGWEELNRRYYERLTDGKPSSPAPPKPSKPTGKEVGP